MSTRLLTLALSLQLTQAQPPPQFEVATIKPSPPGARGSTLYNPTPERYAASSITVKELIAQAYNVRTFQIAAGPSWLASDRYDIVAKPQGEPTPDRIRAMLQSLLKERFNLKLHRENKEAPVYLLVTAKPGPKLKPTTAQAPQMRGRAGTLTAQKVTTALIAQLLSEKVERPIIDRTGITGEFDITLEWTPTDSPEAGMSIFTALQEQLGLKLEAAKSAVDLLVIDQIQRPSAN